MHLMNRPDSNKDQPSLSLLKSRALSSYREIYELGGFSADHIDTVLSALKIHCPNGYGVLSGSDMQSILGLNLEIVIPVCYGLFDSGTLEYLSVKDDHIIYAVERTLSDEVKAIQAQSRGFWLDEYDKAVQE